MRERERERRVKRRKRTKEKKLIVYTAHLAGKSKGALTVLDSPGPIL